MVEYPSPHYAILSITGLIQVTYIEVTDLGVCHGD